MFGRLFGHSFLIPASRGFWMPVGSVDVNVPTPAHLAVNSVNFYNHGPRSDDLSVTDGATPSGLFSLSGMSLALPVDLRSDDLAVTGQATPSGLFSLSGMSLALPADPRSVDLAVADGTTPSGLSSLSGVSLALPANPRSDDLAVTG
jgi:hypothetical protein